MQDSKHHTDPKLSPKSDPDPTKNHNRIHNTAGTVTLHSAIYIPVVDINNPQSYLARVTLYLSRSAVGLRSSVGLTVTSLSLGLGRALHLLPVTLARHVDVVSGLVEGVHAAQVAAILGQLPGGAAQPLLVLLPSHTKQK